MIRHSGLSPASRYALYALIGLLSLLLFLKNAWVAEDCYILLRSVDQFLQGHGFRWNPHERTQVYTSPLWFLLVVGGTAVTDSLYLNVIGLSLLLHLGLLALLARFLAQPWRWAAAVVLLSLSQAFFDFTASGLEYPLAYTLIAGFVLCYLRDRHIADRHWLAACAGLALVTRHDLLCLLLPMLLHVTWQCARQLPPRQWWQPLALVAGPLLLWTLFSLLYYGFPFPNTAYAKLGIPGLPFTDRLHRGWIYTLASLKVDPVTPALIFLAMAKGISAPLKPLRVLALSLVTAYTYVTLIGGDYMLGRFFAPLYLAAVLLLAAAPWSPPWLNRPTGVVLGLACAGLLLLALLAHQTRILDLLDAAGLPPLTSPRPVIYFCLAVGVGLGILAVFRNPWARQTVAVIFAVLLFHSTQQNDSPWQTPYQDWGKTADHDYWWMIDTLSRERYWIYRWTSLHTWWHRDPAQPFPDHPWCHEGAALPSVSLVRFSGMMPYCMGTDRIAVDTMGLTDSFVARMPRNPNAGWLAGGVNRVIPAGYLETLATGRNQLQDPNLAEYYERLALITQSPDLFAPERLKTIVAFNLGAYQHLLDGHKQYAARLKETRP